METSDPMVVDGRMTASVPAPRLHRVQASVSEDELGFITGERLRIARELHDVVAYSFATISVHAGVAAHVADQRPEQALEALRAIKAISREAYRELRGILGLLRAPGSAAAPGQGLAQLGSLATTTTRAGLPTRVVVSGRADRPPAAVVAATYRIVQEALTNALRHAGPASASVFVTCEPDRLIVEVVDDGCGLSGIPRARPPGSQHGIAGVRERAQALGGSLDAGHADIHQDHIRAGLASQTHALLPIGGLTDHRHVRLRLEQDPQAGPQQRLIVGQQHADHDAPP